MPSDLFREEVLTRRSVEGTPLSASRRLKAWALGMVAVVSVSLVAAAFMSHAERVTVRGYVDAADRSVNVFVPRAGVIESVLVAEGQGVTKGQPLLVLTGAEADAAESLKSSLETEFSLLLARRTALDERARTFRQLLRNEVSNIGTVLRHAQQSRRHAERRLELALLRHRRFERLANLADVAADAVLQSADALAASRQQAAVFATSVAQHELDLVRANERGARMETDIDEQRLLLSERKLELERRSIDIDTRRAVMVAAPRTGRINQLQATVGERVTPRRAVLSVSRSAGQVRAVLWVPSSRSGRIEVGQPVRIRFDGYPYQQHGVFDGRVSELSRQALRPDEIEAPLAVLEPSFRAVVALDTPPSIRLDGGMSLEADVIVGRRPAWSWLAASSRRQ